MKKPTLTQIDNLRYTKIFTFNDYTLSYYEFEEFHFQLWHKNGNQVFQSKSAGRMFSYIQANIQDHPKQHIKPKNHNTMTKASIRWAIAFGLLLILTGAMGLELDRSHDKITDLSIKLEDSQMDVQHFKTVNEGFEFVWNGPIEELPKTGDPIKIEKAEGETIYLGPLERSKPLDRQTLESMGILPTDY